MSGLRVNVCGFDNGVGNARDLGLIADALRGAGCQVTISALDKGERRRRRSPLLRMLARARRRWQRKAARPFDITVMLEHIWPERLHEADRNILVPNPEWFDRADRALLDQMDCLWTKTQHAQRLFDALHPRARYIGFDSVDRWLPDVARTPSFLHLAGKSRLKGSARLVRLWARHPEWPLLTVIHSRRAAFETVAAPNIHYETRHLSDSVLQAAQNRHRFHLCTSETEGWGHYIPEAMSVCAVVLVTDAAPMNELVTRERGLPIASSLSGRQHLASLHAFDEAALEQTIEQLLRGGDEAQLAALSAAARGWFAANKAQFPQRVAAALAQLSGA